MAHLIPVGSPFSVSQGAEHYDYGGLRSHRLPRFPALEELRDSYTRRLLLEYMAENSPTTSSFIWTVRQIAAQSKWRFVSNDENDPRVEFLESVFFKDMNQDWDDFLSSVLTNLVHGWSVMEIVHKIRRGPKETDVRYKSVYDDNKVGLRMLSYRPQLSIFDWRFYDDGQIKEMSQQFEGGIRHLNIKNLFFTRTTGIRPDGQSILRGAYPAFFRGQVLEYLEAIGTERDLAGLPVIKLIKDANKGIQPPDLWNPEDQDGRRMLRYLEETVASVRRDRNEGVVMPEWAELELLSAGGGRALSLKDSLERYDLRLLQAIMADFLLLGTAKGAGSYGLGESRQSLFLLAMDGFLGRIGNIINIQLVPELLTMNSMEVNDCPLIIPLPLNPKDLAVLGSFFQSMKQGGLAVNATDKLQEFLSDTTGMPLEVLEQVTPKDELESKNKPGPESDGPAPPRKQN